jgi:predicted extracellular nuclease
LGAISAAAGGVNYSYVDINPLNDEDGGQPGGNIQVAYLYNSEVLELANPNPGSPTDATEVRQGALHLASTPVASSQTVRLGRTVESRSPRMATESGQYHILHRQCTLYELGAIFNTVKPWNNR